MYLVAFLILVTMPSRFQANMNHLTEKPTILVLESTSQIGKLVVQQVNGSSEMSYLPCRICTKDVVRRSPRITTRITPPPHARSARLEPSSCNAGTAP
jgi:hypothetical protein